MSPESVLSQLRRTQHHRIELDNQPMTGIPTISEQRTALLSSLKVSKPTEKRQLSLP